MNGKKAKALRKLFRQAMDSKGLHDERPKYNIRGEVVEVNLWRAFKKQYGKNTSPTS